MNKIAYFEVRQKICSTIPPNELRAFLKQRLEKSICIAVDVNIVNSLPWMDGFALPNYSTDFTIKHIESIICTTNDTAMHKGMQIETGDYETKVFVYKLSQEVTATETMQHDSEELSVASHIILPAEEYQGLWESLYYETNIKDNLLNFIETTMLFSDRKVDHNIISWNKVILLHGPPGTGKTSLCKALAQKAAIRLGERYSYVELVEINSHSLFSKWFSESGKLVMKLFDEIRRLLENSEALVCVLIDEVESLAHARKSCVNGTEPSDAIRVVNALLTQLDLMKRYSNVMILTTSNVTEAIDLAFVDRADIKQYIGHPQKEAIYKIYTTCLEELMRTKLVSANRIPPLEELKQLNFQGYPENSQFLLSLSESSIGLSGRTLRKIPFLAHAMYVQSGKCSFEKFLKAMEITIEKHKEDDFLKE